jgi:hypothetical protein
VADLAHDERATSVRGHVVATLTAGLGRVRNRGIGADGTAPAPVLGAIAKETQ